VRPRDELVGINRVVDGLLDARWEGTRLVRFEDIEAAELLGDGGKGLELLRFEDLFIEPRLDLVLLYLWQLLVSVVDVSGYAVRICKADEGRYMNLFNCNKVICYG
jgi:hypothetical protein